MMSWRVHPNAEMLLLPCEGGSVADFREVGAETASKALTRGLTFLVYLKNTGA